MDREDLFFEDLMKSSKRRLAESLVTAQRQMDQVSRELSAAQREARLLADQRGRLLAFLQVEAAEAAEVKALYTSWAIDQCLKMITDPGDEVPDGA